MPKGCPQSLAKPTPPGQPARSLSYGTAHPYGAHSPRSNPNGGYGSVYAGIYGQPVQAPAASTSAKHTGARRTSSLLVVVVARRASHRQHR